MADPEDESNQKTDAEDRKMPARDSSTMDGGGHHRNEPPKRARKRKRLASNLSSSPRGVGLDTVVTEEVTNSPTGPSNFNATSGTSEILGL
jgi:hypothetical protein